MKITTYKKTIMAALFCAINGVASYAQDCCQSTKSSQLAGYYTQYYGNQPELKKKAQEWMDSGEWRNGFNLAKPHKSVNAVEFYQQYQKNPKQWKALFEYLAHTDLLSISKGKHPIPGTSLVVSVEDTSNQPLEKRKSESHHHHIDFQYVVRGTERFAVIDHYSSKPNCAYRPDVIHYDYDKQKARYYDSTPDEFFIFFPRDWHIAKIANSTNDQQIRVIVIKVDYVD